MLGAKVPPVNAGCQDTSPVYCAVDVIVVTAVAPLTGVVTPGIAAMLIATGSGAAVAGNCAVITPEFAALVAACEVPATVKKFAGTPSKVKPFFAVSIISPVYIVEGLK